MSGENVSSRTKGISGFTDAEMQAAIDNSPRSAAIGNSESYLDNILNGSEIMSDSDGDYAESSYGGGEPGEIQGSSSKQSEILRKSLKSYQDAVKLAKDRAEARPWYDVSRLGDKWYGTEEQFIAAQNLREAEKIFAKLPDELPREALIASSNVLSNAIENRGVSGKQAYELRKFNNSLWDIYASDGPKLGSGLSEKESAYLAQVNEDRRYFANSIGIAAGGPVFAALPIYARAFGANEDVVEALGRVNFDLAMAFAGGSGKYVPSIPSGKPAISTVVGARGSSGTNRVNVSGVFKEGENIQAVRFGELNGGGDFAFANNANRTGIEGYFYDLQGQSTPVSLKNLTTENPKNVFRTIRGNAEEILFAEGLPVTNNQSLPKGSLQDTVIHVQTPNIGSETLKNFINNAKPNIFMPNAFKEVILDAPGGVIVVRNGKIVKGN